MDAPLYILDRINIYFRNFALESHSTILGKDYYQYYQTPLSFIQDALLLIKNREGEIKGKKFIDLGSGCGYVCGVAAKLGLVAEGVEINPILCDVSSKIFPEIKFYNINILDFDRYQEFDIVFYYLPFYNPELQQIFKKKVEDNIRIGTYIIKTENEEQFPKENKRFINIFNNQIWQKIE